MVAKPLNRISGMPQMGAAFAGWSTALTIYKRCQTVEDSLVTYTGNPTEFDEDGATWDTPGEVFDVPAPTVTKISFKGVIQPLKPKEIQLKPEGQRAFTWLQIHCFSGSLNLDTDDQIIIDGKDYKVMAVLDYSRNNFMEYHVIRDYQGPCNG